MNKYDLSKFYSLLKIKFDKSNAEEIMVFLLSEFAKAMRLKDEIAIISIGNELASYQRVAGRVEESYKIYDLVGKLTKKHFGANSKEYASYLLNLADVDIVSKKYKMAVERLGESLEILSHFEDEDYLLASAYNNRSSAFSQLNEYTLAESDIENAIRLVKNESKIAISKINLSQIQKKQKKYSQAIENIRYAIEYFLKNNPKDIHLAHAYATYGDIYYQLGEYDRSINELKKARQIIEEKIGKGPSLDMINRNMTLAEKGRSL